MPNNNNETEETLKPVTKKKRKSYGIGCRRRYEAYLLDMDRRGITTIDFKRWAEINC